MENIPQQALIPREQDVILFHGNEILAVRLPDDRIAATLNSLCAVLGILPHGQIQRIRRDEYLAQHLLLAFVKTAGGLQLMDVLIAEHISDWVMGLQLKRIALKKRPLILALKAEIVDALHRHFFPEQETRPRPEPQAEPEASIRSGRGGTSAASDSPWDRLFDALYDIRQAEQARDRQITELKTGTPGGRSSRVKWRGANWYERCR
jgi:hypothetical protein